MQCDQQLSLNLLLLHYDQQPIVENVIALMTSHQCKKYAVHNLFRTPDEHRSTTVTSQNLCQILSAFWQTAIHTSEILNTDVYLHVFN